MPPPKGPPVSLHVPLVIVNVGEWPLFLSFPLTYPLLPQVNLKPLRFQTFLAELVLMFMGDWALLSQICDTFPQSFGPKPVEIINLFA